MTRRLPWYGGALVALVLAGLALHSPGAANVGPEWRVYAFVGVLAVAGGVYALAVRRVLARPERGVGIVLLVACAMRLPLIPQAPFLSSDLFRYVWDGRVQAAGFNPYCCIPDDPTLAGVRDDAIYPRVNRHEYAPTIYPPAAQAVFRAVAAFGGTVIAEKLVMFAFEALAVLCLLHLLDRAGLPRARALIYAWNPLAAWAFAGNGHVDAAAIGLLGIALLARARGAQAAAGVALAGAALIKFIPAVVAPALWRRGDWRLPAAFAVTVGALYACYAGAGVRVFGYLPSYGAEEGLDRGVGFWPLAGLAQFGPLPAWAAPIYLAVVLAALATLACLIAFRRPVSDDPVTVCARVATLAAVAIAALSPHYPWYFPWLAMPAAVAPSAPVIWLSVAPLIQYLNPGDERFWWPALVYVPLLVLACRARPRPAPLALIPAARST